MTFGHLELHDYFDIFFLGVNQSGLGTSSIANHKFYKALGQLHGPWCKHPQDTNTWLEWTTLVAFKDEQCMRGCINKGIKGHCARDR